VREIEEQVIRPFLKITDVVNYGKAIHGNNKDNREEQGKKRSGEEVMGSILDMLSVVCRRMAKQNCLHPKSLKSLVVTLC
jgi:hypothetical protein